MNTVFIYGLNDPRTGECRYLGKTTRPQFRVAEHLSQAQRRRARKDCWLRGLISSGLRPRLEIIDEVPELEWEFWEREYIRVFRMIGVRLTNSSGGGESPTGLTEDSRRRMREAAKARTFSDETRAKMRASHLGQVAHNRGKKHSEETRRKISEGGRGLKRSQETRDRISQALSGRTFSQTHRLNISRAKRGF